MDIPPIIRPLLTSSARAWTYRLLILVYAITFTLTLRTCEDAPGARSSPRRSQLGKSESLDRGGSINSPKNLKHYALFPGWDSHKLLSGLKQKNKCDIVLCNYHVMLHIGNMTIHKQHIILSLIRSGRYELNQETGEVISNIGLQPRVLQPIEHYSGYLQYSLDIGFSERIMVYGQGFSYIAYYLTTYNPKYVIDHIDQDKSNNRPSNLRCITEQENTEGNFKKLDTGSKRRLPIDHIEAIKSDFKLGISMVKLAVKYRCTRQTISKIVNVKQ